MGERRSPLQRDILKGFLVLKKVILYIISCCCFFQPASVFSWNALGHRLIAQIAYDQLKPRTIRILNRYNHAVDKGYKPMRLVDSAVWLDYVKYQHKDTYSAMHYIDLSFSEDGTALPPLSDVNAETAIEQALHTLEQANMSDYNKGIALRILLHVVGDIHQPLHATSQVSRRYPDGDRGGNDVALAKNPIAKNLHSYWDNGAGYLKINTKKKHAPSLKKMATELEHNYPCNRFSLETNPSQWAKESHEFGVGAYQTLYHTIPDRDYQFRSISIVKKRIAMAGCRLAALLNHLAENNVYTRFRSF